jgi:hypothetical protein
MACAEARALGPDMDTDNSQLPVAAVPAENVPTPVAPDTRPLYERIGNAAWDVTRAYGDEDLGAPERAVYVLQRLLPPSVRAYAEPDRCLMVFFDAGPGDDLSKLPGAYTLAQAAGYVEAVHPEGSATVLKDRTHWPLPIPLPMSTEVLHMADHVFVDYWAGDSVGRSEVCARVKDGRIDCGKPFEHHPKG